MLHHRARLLSDSTANDADRSHYDYSDRRLRSLARYKTISSAMTERPREACLVFD